MTTPKPTPCEWTIDDDCLWNSDCGNSFVFESEGPHENGFKFCPYCGNKMEAVHAPD